MPDTGNASVLPKKGLIFFRVWAPEFRLYQNLKPDLSGSGYGNYSLTEGLESA